MFGQLQPFGLSLQVMEPVMSKAEKTKQRIIEEAAVIFNEKGISGTSIEDVLKATKIAKGCLYGHFESKEELSYASVDYLLAKVTDRRDAVMRIEKTARCKIFAFIDSNKNPLIPYINGGCPLINLATESDDTSPVIKKKVRITVNQTIKLLSGILREGVESGEFSLTLNAEDFAMQMFVSIEGANALCRVLNSNKPMQVVMSSLKMQLDSFSIINPGK